VGGVPEVLSDPATGWLVPPGDRTRFVEGMKAAARLGPDERIAMGDAARAHVAERFDAPRQYAKLVQIIEQGAAADGRTLGPDGIADGLRALPRREASRNIQGLSC
jgi:glycosyltransferase involved in cell wall biosynthesis